MNFFAHGSQDLYPTFLREQRGFDPHTVGTIAVVLNIGAMLGSITFGALSDRIGRLHCITIGALLALVPLWAWSHGATPLGLAMAGFCLQFAIGGAWGVIPVHLSELSPDRVRGTFPGVTYQIGNLLAAIDGPLQTAIAARNGNDYSLGLVLVVGTMAIAIAALSWLGPETKGATFAGARLASETAR